MHITKTVQQEKFGKLRWYGLGICTIILILCFFLSDIQTPIQSKLQTHFKISQSQYLLIGTIGTYASLPLIFYGKLISRYFSISMRVIVIHLILIVSQAIITFSISLTNLPLYIIGKFLFGVGFSNQIVLIDSLISKYFIGKEIGFALGFSFSLGRLGIATNSNLTPRIYNYYNSLVVPYIFSLILCIALFLLAIIVAWLEIKHEKIQAQDTDNNDSAKHTSYVELSHIKDISKGFWFLLAITTLLFGVYNPFLNVGPKLINKIYGKSTVESADLMSIPIYMLSLSCPLLGLMIDKIGKRVTVLFVSHILLTITILHLIYVPINFLNSQNVYIPLVLFGVSQGFFVSTVWPSFPMTIKIEYIATGLSIANTGTSLGQIAVYPLISLILEQVDPQDTGKGYYAILWLYFGFIAISLICNILLKVYDDSHENTLEKSIVKDGEKETLLSEAENSI